MALDVVRPARVALEGEEFDTAATVPVMPFPAAEVGLARPRALLLEQLAHPRQTYDSHASSASIICES